MPVKEDEAYTRLILAKSLSDPLFLYSVRRYFEQEGVEDVRRKGFEAVARMEILSKTLSTDPLADLVLANAILSLGEDPLSRGYSVEQGVQPLFDGSTRSGRMVANPETPGRFASDESRKTGLSRTRTVAEFMSAVREDRRKDLISAALRLSTEERDEAQVLLAAEIIQDPDLRKLGLLALYDKKEWKEYVDLLSREGAAWRNSRPAGKDSMEELSLFDLISPLAEQGPGSWRSSMLAQIALRRQKAPKGGTGLAPRRALDRLWSLVLDPARRLEDCISQGKTALQAYDALMKLVSGAIHGDKRPVYGSDEVLNAATALQKLLSAVESKERGRTETIVIGGSFVDGRADSDASDIDIVDQKVEIREEFFDEIVGAIRQALRRKVRVERAGIPFRRFPGWGFSEEEMSDVSPLFIEIRPESLTLIAYRFDHRRIAFKLR